MFLQMLINIYPATRCHILRISNLYGNGVWVSQVRYFGIHSISVCVCVCVCVRACVRACVRV
jgi:hypothetical protein